MLLVLLHEHWIDLFQSPEVLDHLRPSLAGTPPHRKLGGWDQADGLSRGPAAIEKERAKGSAEPSVEQLLRFGYSGALRDGWALGLSPG